MGYHKNSYIFQYTNIQGPYKRKASDPLDLPRTPGSVLNTEAIFVLIT